MKFISIIITFLIIFNFNSSAYSNDYKSFKSELISNINIENSFLLSNDNIDLSLKIDKSNSTIFSNPFIVGHIPLLISYILSAFILSESARKIYQSKDISYFYDFPLSIPLHLLYDVNQNNNESENILQTYSIVQLSVLSILSGVFTLYYADKNYESNLFMTILGAFIGTILYFTSFNFSVILESQITYNNKSSLASSSFLILLVIMPIFTSVFATIFYNETKKTKEKVLTKSEIIEEKIKIQKVLLSSLNNIQVNRGNIEYKVLSF